MLLKRKHLFGTTILAGVMAIAAAPAYAQDAQDPEVTEVEEIVVTGSRIRRDPTNAPTPLIQVSREQLTETGQSSVIDYLATIPALSNSLVPSDTTGSLNIGGVSLPNLRSLGTGRTLTLVDGRRHVGATAGSLAVDIDSIPRLLIENIEIVTGGASSVYGADAVSGVLNFVLRNDFEGLEIDANIGMINQDGQLNRRFSVLTGANLFDDRLNVYVHGEYDRNEEVTSLDIDWLEDSNILVITDVDSAAVPSDGFVDRTLFSGVRRMDRVRWGQTTLANTQPGSPLNDPDVAYLPCSNAAGATAITNANCYNVTPGLTYYYDGAVGRLADFGTRIGQPINGTTSSRPLNIGGDGENRNIFAAESRIPETESQRFQAGTTFDITSNVRLYAEAKYVEEDTYFTSQPTFYDAFINNETYAANQSTLVRSNTQFDLRTDNAYLPANVRAAILSNQMVVYSTPTATTGSVATGTVLNPRARHSLFGPQRSQDNHREVERYVVSLTGDLDQLLFVDNFNWELAYVRGEARNLNIERGTDSMRFAYAADAVVDPTGAVNGRPGEIVCRIRLNAATGNSATNTDRLRGGQFTATPEGTAELNQCVPLNIFGAGNQSQEALDYIDASIFVSHVNEQEQGLAVVSGQVWDFFGAGPIGVALGAEYRREYTEGVGRSRSTGNRLLLLNTGADFPGAEYETEEAFAEVSIPLLRDSWLGQYAELSGSFRYADYTTVGETEVYGVNLVYRPIQDIAFKTSFNTSIRVPNLSENFSPFSQTFANGFVDPCATTNILNQTNTEIRNNRIANCQTLLSNYNAANGTALAFDFAGTTATNLDDFVPTYTSGIAGVNGGNPLLRPEESESFTFSTVIQPRFAPDLTLILDYYEIEINDVIAAVTAQTAANQCVNSVGLTPACDTIFRRDPTPGRGFYVGAPAGDPIGGFIQGSINYAKLQTRGLDFTARYTMDLEERFGLNWGRIDYSVGGLWLIEQKQFLNAANAAAFTELSSTTFYPRVRLTSSLTYTPNDDWSFNWTMDWQTAQDIVATRDLLTNLDFQSVDQIDTGNFARHDFTVRYRVNDQLTLRTGVVNAFDAEQPQYLSDGSNGSFLASNFDPYGTRFFFGLNFRPY